MQKVDLDDDGMEDIDKFWDAEGWDHHMSQSRLRYHHVCC
jgi:hypothetical protein